MTTTANTASYVTRFIRTGADSFIHTDGKSQSGILKELKDKNLKISAGKLSLMLKGELAEHEGLKAYKTQPHIGTNKVEQAADAGAQSGSTETAAAPAAAPAPVAAPAAPAAPKVARVRKPSLYEISMSKGAHPDANKPVLTDAQKALVAEVEATTGESAVPKKISMKGTDWKQVLPLEPQPVKKDSIKHRLFVMLCTPGGVTKEQMMAEFGWSSGGFGGVIHWDPKAFGYLLLTEKREGKLFYSLGYHGQPGRLVQPEEVPLKEAKAAAAPKAPKEPKAPKVSVPKAAAPAEGDTGGARITSRRATKKADEATPAA